MNPIRLLLVSSSPTYGRTMSSQRGYQSARQFSSFRIERQWTLEADIDFDNIIYSIRSYKLILILPNTFCSSNKFIFVFDHPILMKYRVYQLLASDEESKDGCPCIRN
jgi:hypothetical protein